MFNLLMFMQMPLFFPFTRMVPCGAWTKHTDIHMDVGLCTGVHSQRFEIYEIHLGNRIGLHRAHVSNDSGASRAHGWRHALRRVELSAVLKGQSMVHPLMPVHWFLDCSAIFINLWVVIAFFSIWCMQCFGTIVYCLDYLVIIPLTNLELW